MYAVAIDLESAQLSHFIAGPFSDYSDAASAASDWGDSGALHVVWDCENNCEAKRPTPKMLTKRELIIELRERTKPELSVGKSYLFDNGTYWTYEGMDFKYPRHKFTRSGVLGEEPILIADECLHLRVQEFIEWDKIYQIPAQEELSAAPVDQSSGEASEMAVTEGELVKAFKGMDILNGWSKSEYSYEELANIVIANVRLSRRMPSRGN